jgi:hypothetical protein
LTGNRERSGLVALLEKFLLVLEALAYFSLPPLYVTGLESRSIGGSHAATGESDRILERRMGLSASATGDPGDPCDFVFGVDYAEKLSTNAAMASGGDTWHRCALEPSEEGGEGITIPSLR